MKKNRLALHFFKRSAPLVARDLLGKIISHQTKEGKLSGMIVETEAYGENDPASHAFCGPTPRNRVMFGPAGRTYVYFTYGKHHCFNVTTDPTGKAGAVLIRAAVPLKGIKIMQKKRRTKELLNLTSGPAKFAQAFGFNRQHNNLSVLGPKIIIVDNPGQSFKISRTTRIGVRPEKNPRRWRFYIKENPFISKK